MSDYKVTYTETTELEFDLEDLKDSFGDEWGENILNGGDDESFIQFLIDEYGVSYLKELQFLSSLRDDEYSLDIEKL